MKRGYTINKNIKKSRNIQIETQTMFN